MRTPPWWYVLIASFLSSIIVSLGALVISVHYTQVMTKKFCDVLSAQDSPEQPPTTERGRVVAEKIRTLRRSIDCP